MKKLFAFCNSLFQKRSLGLLFLLLLCNNAFEQNFCRPGSNTNSICFKGIGSGVTNPTVDNNNDAGLTTFFIRWG
ncbi:hypothetical protein SD960_10975 [Flavobacterium sp. MMLR14_040]|uniref:hypothetical protein n=1 Tax=Flavobacterium sp. MMLR14_040 TaxID=3093843 RepID=UPI00298FC4F9|nr:hypothetical protein [Flavobacterium sp. MMLR14_040]MDW8850618.1 hypothetical protein [Flavobacterium sp. MMLR14_040]